MPAGQWTVVDTRDDRTVPYQLCASCGFSLRRPDDWTGQYWATIKDNRGVHHYWCWSSGDTVERIERTAQAAWEAGL